MEIEKCLVNWVSIFSISNYCRLGSLLRYGSLFTVVKVTFSPPAMLDGEEKLSQGREANQTVYLCLVSNNKMPIVELI